MHCFLNWLTVLLLLLSVCLCRCDTQSGGGPILSVVPNVTALTRFNLSGSQAGDLIICLSADATATVGFAVSALGQIFVWPLKARPSMINPLYSKWKSDLIYDANACQANPEGTVLYILDRRGQKLWSYTLSTPSADPTVVVFFPKEISPSLTSLAIDFNDQVAYVGTKGTYSLYSVNLTNCSIEENNEVSAPITALALSADNRILYFATPALPGDVPATINSLPVNAGDIPDSYNSTIIYSSLSIIYPTSMISNTSHVILTDGGPTQGYDNCYDIFPQYIYAVTLSGQLSTLLTTTAVNLPSGLLISWNKTELFFTTSTCERVPTVNILYALSLDLLAYVSPTPITSFGCIIPYADGVALSADGTRAFVHTASLLGSSVYVIPLPINSSSDPNPSPYWINLSSLGTEFSYIAASSSASPQLVYLLDNYNAQLRSLAIISPAPINTSLVYDLGRANQYLVGGMTSHASTHLLYLTLNTGFDGGAHDRIVVVDPTSPSPSLRTLYTASFSAYFLGVAVSSIWIYISTATDAHTTKIAQVWAVPVRSANNTTPILLYTTVNTNFSSLRIGDLVHPSGLVLNAAESILYIADTGNENVPVAESIQAVYALSPLYPGLANLSVVSAYTHQMEFLSHSFALAPDQSTLYFARRGRPGRSGLYFTINANSSIPKTSPSLSASSSTGGVSSTPTSASPILTAPTSSSSSSSITSAPSSASSVPPAAVTSGTGQSSSLPTPADPSTNDGTSTGQEVGVVVGVLVVLMVLGGGAAVVITKYWKRGRQVEESSILREPMLTSGYHAAIAQNE